MLHKLLGLSSGDSLLYVGDHIYSDILRSKRTLGWRTCLIIPELPNEIATYKKHRARRLELLESKRKQYIWENQLDKLFVRQQRLSQNKDTSDPIVTAELAQISSTTEELKDRIKALKVDIRQKQLDYDAEFHPRWGQLFKARFQESRLAKQVNR